MLDEENNRGAGYASTPWMTAVKCVLLFILAAMIFLLAEQMVKHRFFRGGWVNHNGTIRP